MSVQQDLQGPSATSEEARMVLIVDDEPSMRTALSETVRRLGYQVRGAIDGVDAIETLAGGDRFKDAAPDRAGTRQGHQTKIPPDVHCPDDRLRHGGDSGGSDEIRRQ